MRASACIGCGARGILGNAMAETHTEHGPHALVGRVVDGRFRIERPLGEGAVGTVYQATELPSGRPVAFKRWHATGNDKQVRGRFEREARALDTLKHPNIVEVYGHGIVDDVPYVAMELLRGQTLEDMLESGEPLPAEAALDIADQMLQAIAHAHSHDVVHRDLKPENVFVAADGQGGRRVKILDYGLAKFMTPEADPMQGANLTVTGMMMGTALYMPPEQAAGSAVDLPVDVYAAGCVLFEMLTGRPPYLADNQMELIRAHMKDPIPRVGDMRSDVEATPQLRALLEAALAKKQTDRYRDAGAMLAALRALPKPMLRRPAGAPPPAALQRRPSAGASGAAAQRGGPSVAGLAAAAVALLAAVLYFALR